MKKYIVEQVKGRPKYLHITLNFQSDLDLRTIFSQSQGPPAPGSERQENPCMGYILRHHIVTSFGLSFSYGMNLTLGRETFLPAFTSSVCKKDRGIFNTTIVSGYCFRVNLITVFDYKRTKSALLWGGGGGGGGGGGRYLVNF